MLRIAHLLLEKSSRERTHLTFTELSDATGIPVARLRTLNESPTADPTDAELGQLAGYLNCAREHLIDRSTMFEFDMSDVFPNNDPLSATVLRLMVACNDLSFLTRQWLNLENETHMGVKQFVRNAEKNFVFLLSSGFLREGMNAFRCLVADRNALSLIEKMDDDSRMAYQALKNASDSHDSPYNKTFKDIRDIVFHYDQQKYLAALGSIRQRPGHFVVGLTGSETRFLIADDIRSEVLKPIVNFDDATSASPTLEAVIDTEDSLMRFTRGFLMVYLGHRGASVDPIDHTAMAGDAQS